MPGFELSGNDDEVIGAVLSEPFVEHDVIAGPEIDGGRDSFAHHHHQADQQPPARAGVAPTSHDSTGADNPAGGTQRWKKSAGPRHSTMFAVRRRRLSCSCGGRWESSAGGKMRPRHRRCETSRHVWSTCSLAMTGTTLAGWAFELATVCAECGDRSGKWAAPVR